MRARTSVYAFSAYLAGLCACLMVAPNTLLGMFGIPATNEVWIRVIGVIAGVLGYYYGRAARADLRDFLRWSVDARLAVLVFFALFVAVGLAPWQLVLFGAVDAAGAVWTLLALRADARGRGAQPLAA